MELCVFVREAVVLFFLEHLDHFRAAFHAGLFGIEPVDPLLKFADLSQHLRPLLGVSRGCAAGLSASGLVLQCDQGWV